MTGLEELTAQIKADGATARKPRQRRRDSEIAQQLGCTPAQLRRARYLAATGKVDQLEAEGLAHLSRRKT